jgi:hypothetical protein
MVNQGNSRVEKIGSANLSNSRKEDSLVAQWFYTKYFMTPEVETSDPKQVDKDFGTIM